MEAHRELSGVVEEVAEDDYPSDLGVLDELNAIERAAVYLVDGGVLLWGRCTDRRMFGSGASVTGWPAALVNTFETHTS
ncbi:MAG: hypothetical protein R2699_07630 [Acidimicrobiales bacterium]